MDISDGLITDLKKLINKQKFGYKVYLDNLPISKNLEFFLRNYKTNKLNFISRGDDYQILFTASKKKRK